MDDGYTIKLKDAADRLGISKSSLQKKAMQRTIDVKKIGNAWKMSHAQFRKLQGIETEKDEMILQEKEIYDDNENENGMDEPMITSPRTKLKSGFIDTLFSGKSPSQSLINISIRKNGVYIASEEMAKDAFSHSAFLDQIKRKYGQGNYNFTFEWGNKRETWTEKIGGNDDDDDDDNDEYFSSHKKQMKYWENREENSGDHKILSTIQESNNTLIGQLMMMHKQNTENSQLSLDRERENHRRDMDKIERMHQIQIEQLKEETKTKMEQLRIEAETRIREAQIKLETEEKRLSRMAQDDKDRNKEMTGLFVSVMEQKSKDLQETVQKISQAQDKGFQAIERAIEMKKEGNEQIHETKMKLMEAASQTDMSALGQIAGALTSTISNWGSKQQSQPQQLQQQQQPGQQVLPEIGEGGRKKMLKQALQSAEIRPIWNLMIRFIKKIGEGQSPNVAPFADMLMDIPGVGTFISAYIEVSDTASELLSTEFGEALPEDVKIELKTDAGEKFYKTLKEKFSQI